MITTNQKISTLDWRVLLRFFLAITTVVFSFAAHADGEFKSAGLEKLQINSGICNGWWGQASWKCTPASIPGYLAVPNDTSKNIVVIVSHGSQGLDLHHRWYADHLAEQGYYALVLDHWTPRGLGQVQRSGYTKASLGSGGNALNMAIDTLAATVALRKDERFKNARFAHLGESMGASVARELNRPWVYRAAAQVLGEEPTEPKAFIALYMGCTEKNKNDRFKNIPVLFINGDKDDDTAVGPCRDFVQFMNDRGGNAKLVEIPGAYHQFDSFYKLAYFGDIENPSQCANTGDPEGKIYTLDKTGKTYPFNSEGFAALRKDCIGRGAHAGGSGIEGVGFDLWTNFLAETLRP